MDFIKEWSYTVCVTLIISVIFSILTPKGSMGRFYKVILASFIFLSFIYPFTNAEIEFEIPDFDEVSHLSEQKDVYENLIFSKVNETLEKGGYTACVIDGKINYNKNGEIEIKEITVSIPDNFDKIEVKNYLFENLGIKPEVYYIGE